VSNHDFYEGFADRYDLSPDRFDQHDPLMSRFFRELFEQHDVHSVLDCACGTGRHLLLFQDLGYEVWGSDLSKAMLVQAHKNMTSFGRDVTIIQADYRDLPLHFKREFDAVACLGSIGYMPDEAEFLRAFRSMYAVLHQGGILLLTTIPTDKEWREKPRFKLVFNSPDITRLFVMDYFERTVGYHILDIFHSRETDELRVWNAELTVLLRDEQERLLKIAGFQQVDFYGAFDFSPYEKESSGRLIAIAYK
jgi:glycine/sarcosine N-methyltransferase